jgi:hypothetical protein
MQSSTKRIDGHDWRSFRNTIRIEWLTNNQSPPIQTLVLPGCHETAFDTSQQHRSINP